MYELVQHTADLRLKVRADSMEELFAEALRAMMESLRPEGIAANPSSEHPVEVDSVDATSLLIDFLNEVLYLAHVEREIFNRVRFRTLTETHLVAQLSGHKTERFDEDIKAVTYHEADVRRTDAQKWETTLVFDI